MRTNIRSTGAVKLSDNVKEYINTRLETFQKLFNESENVVANILCKQTDKNVVVEITIPLKHITLRAESCADTLYGAIENVKELVIILVI